MKAQIKKIDFQGQVITVQLTTDALSDLEFKPGAPAIKSGGLIITEINESGVVGLLRAQNTTEHFLLLTDADILSGAKQTRIVNKSLLLAPHSTTMLDVSCVERSRWSKVSDKFDTSSHAAANELRVEKAMFYAKEKGNADKNRLQSQVWNKIEDEMKSNSFRSHTESYEDLASFKQKENIPSFPEVKQMPESTGLMVIRNGKVESLDLFGQQQVFEHYFESLILAVQRSGMGKKTDEILPEAAVEDLVRETFQKINSAREDQDKNYMGAGQFHHMESKDIIGGHLSYNKDLIHLTAFTR